MIWLLGKLAPDFKTIADFRKDNLKALTAVCRQFTRLCRKLELFGGELVAIDGSKFKAVNARDQNFNQSKLQALIAAADARLAGYWKQLDEADEQEASSAALSQGELQQKIAAVQEKKNWHEELLVELRADEEKQISVTDPDTRRMPTAQGNQVGYNAQLAVDAKHKLIAAAVSNDVTDFNQLANLALEAKANLEFQQAEVLADAGYYNASEVSRCVEQNIQPLIPKADTSANSKLGLFGKNRFQFDASNDVYVCRYPVDVSVQHLRTGTGAALLPRARLRSVRPQATMHAHQSQPDDHARSQRTFNGSDAPDMGVN